MIGDTEAFKPNYTTASQDQHIAQAVPPRPLRSGAEEHSEAQCQMARSKRLSIRSNGRLLLLDSDEIDWLKSADNYVEIQAGHRCYLVRGTLHDALRRLNPTEFTRIHRRFVVHIPKIRELVPQNGNSHIVALRNGANLPCSRRYRSKLKLLLGLTAPVLVGTSAR